MCTHVTVILKNESGAFSRLAEILQAQQINVLAFHIATLGPRSGYAQILCDDSSRALSVLLPSYGSYVYESTIFIVRKRNIPGSLADVMSHLARETINVENAYQTLGDDGSAYIIIEPDGTKTDTTRRVLQDTYGEDLIEDIDILIGAP